MCLLLFGPVVPDGSLLKEIEVHFHVVVGAKLAGNLPLGLLLEVWKA